MTTGGDAGQTWRALLTFYQDAEYCKTKAGSFNVVSESFSFQLDFCASHKDASKRPREPEAGERRATQAPRAECLRAPRTCILAL